MAISNCYFLSSWQAMSKFLGIGLQGSGYTTLSERGLIEHEIPSIATFVNFLVVWFGITSV